MGAAQAEGVPGGRGGPADGVLWLRSAARAMWKTLACEPSLVWDVLTALLHVSHESSRLHSAEASSSCRRLLAVSVWASPAPSHPGLRAPSSPSCPLRLPPAPALPGAPGPGASAHSQAGQRVLLGPAAHRQAACPCPAALGGPAPSPPPPAGSAAGRPGAGRLLAGAGCAAGTCLQREPSPGLFCR